MVKNCTYWLNNLAVLPHKLYSKKNIIPIYLAVDTTS